MAKGMRAGAASHAAPLPSSPRSSKRMISAADHRRQGVICLWQQRVDREDVTVDDVALRHADRQQRRAAQQVEAADRRSPISSERGMSRDGASASSLIAAPRSSPTSALIVKGQSAALRQKSS
jgi:hypothetical protein